MAKNKKKNKGPYAWRLERQTIEMMRITEYVSVGVSTVGVAAVALFLIRSSMPWLMAAMGILVLTVVLDILYPAYFTLIPPEKGEKKPAHGLWVVWSVLCFFLMMIISKCNLLEYKLLLWLGVACGVVTAVVLGLWAEEFKREKCWLLVAFLIGGLIGGAFAGYCNIRFDKNPRQVYTLAVEDLRRSGGKVRNYYCTVTMPDGRQEELEIDHSTWIDLEEGDPVKVVVGQGALGVGYIVADTAE